MQLTATCLAPTLPPSNLRGVGPCMLPRQPTHRSHLSSASPPCPPCPLCLQDKASELADNVRDGAASAWDATADKASELAEGARDGAASARDATADKAREAAAAAGAKMKEAGEKVEGAGDK